MWDIQCVHACVCVHMCHVYAEGLGFRGQGSGDRANVACLDNGLGHGVICIDGHLNFAYVAIQVRLIVHWHIFSKVSDLDYFV